LSAPHIAAIVGGVILLRGREKEGEGRRKEKREMEGRVVGGDCLIFILLLATGLLVLVLLKN